MKNQSIIRNLLFALVLFFSATFNLNAQPTIDPPMMAFLNGCIITNDGDTIYGSIKAKIKFVENHFCQIQFKTDRGETDLIEAGEIQGFGFDNSSLLSTEEHIVDNPWTFYESRPSFKKGQMVFMNRLAKGKINVFQNRSSMNMQTAKIKEHSKIDGISFSFSSDEGLNIGPTYHVSYQTINSKSWYSSYFVDDGSGGIIKVEKENYEGIMADLFGDSEAINRETEKNPDLLKFKNFLLLVEIYNNISN